MAPKDLFTFVENNQDDIGALTHAISDETLFDEEGDSEIYMHPFGRS